MTKFLEEAGADSFFLAPWRDRRSARDQVLDRLADLMFCADEVLNTVRGNTRDESLARIEGEVRHIYDRANELMKGLVS